MRACRLPTWGTRHRSACPYLPYRRLCYHRLGRSSSGGGWFSQTPWREAEACGGFKGAVAAPLAGHGQKSSGREPDILGVGGAGWPRRLGALDGPGAILANCEGS